jgi:hypothetical protein
MLPSSRRTLSPGYILISVLLGVIAGIFYTESRNSDRLLGVALGPLDICRQFALNLRPSPMPTETVRNSDASKVPRNIQRSCLLPIVLSSAQTIVAILYDFDLNEVRFNEIICHHKSLLNWDLYLSLYTYSSLGTGLAV